MSKKRYAQVGLGGRSLMYTAAILEPYRDSAELVGLCDLNAGRLALRQRWATDHGGGDVPGYLHTDFERMIAATRPDTVIVTTKDCTHDHYICRALELGCDVVTEKPMTTDELSASASSTPSGAPAKAHRRSTTATRRRARRSKTC